MKEKNKSNIIGIIFLIWFFLSLVLLLYFSNKNGYYVAIVGGQYFLVFGIAHMFSMKKITIPGICLASAGIACIIIPFMMLHPEIFGKLNWDEIITMLSLYVFIIVGLGLVFIPLINNYLKRKKCNVTVEAKVIKNDGLVGHTGEYMTCPVYEFEYMGSKYEVTDNTYTNVNTKEEQDIITIGINPDNPNEFVEYKNEKIKYMIIMGIFVLTITIPVLIYVLFFK